jgi:DNA invertase Pin-like site-specific DNA recombinase
MIEPKPVAGYYRVSQARDDMKAPELYEDEIRRYCAYRKLELARIFSDIDYSGYRGARPRPALEELTARRHDFSAVVVPKLARFGRSVKDLVTLFDLFDSDGIALLFLDMNIDTSTSQGRLLRHVMAAFAEYESDVKADYARANHRRVRAEGRPWGGRPPFGYDHHPSERSYVVNSGRASIVRHAFALYADGISANRIAVELNRKGMVRPSEAPWTCQQVGHLLDNPAYAALCIVDDDLVAAVWEPIIARDTWEAVRRLRAGDKRRRRQLRVTKGGPYLLSGMLYCGYCGGKLKHRSRAGKEHGIYVCVDRQSRWCPGGSIDCALIDAFVTQRFLDRCRFTIDGRDRRTFAESERAWERASLLDRRKLLALAIRRIVVVPWPGGDAPQRTPGKLREVEIEWAHGSGATAPLAMITSPEPAPPIKRKVSEGRSDMMRELEASVAERRRKERSERSKAAWARWRQIQEEFIARGWEEFGRGE